MARRSFAVLALLPYHVVAMCHADATGCNVWCDTPSGNLTYTLGDFKQQLPQGTDYFHAKDTPDNHDYWFAACGIITAVTCQPDDQGTTVAKPAALQSWGSNPPTLQGQCAALGDYTAQVCSPIGGAAPPNSANNVGAPAPPPAGDPGSGGGLRCTYTGGDTTPDGNARSVSIVYTCGQAYKDPTAAQQQGSDAYEINFEGPGACGAVITIPKQGLSGGSIFLIVLAVSVFLYLGGGMTYNYKVRELRGTELVPQIDYWKQLPGLVKDGCKFSWHHSQRIYNQWRHGKDSAMNPDGSLKQGLNDEDEPLRQ